MARRTCLKTARSCLHCTRPELPVRYVAPWQFRKPYSIQSEEEAIAHLPGIDPSKLSVLKTTTPKELMPPEELVFGSTFTGDNRCSIRGQVADQDSYNYRSYAFDRMDRIAGMALTSNNALPESKPRSRNLRLPLCIRMLRGHESLQEQIRPSKIIQA